MSKSYNKMKKDEKTLIGPDGAGKKIGDMHMNPKMKKASLGMKQEDQSGYSKSPVDVKETVQRDPKAIEMEDAKNKQEAIVMQAHTGHDKAGMNKNEPKLEAGMSYKTFFKIAEGEPLAKPKK